MTVNVTKSIEYMNNHYLKEKYIMRHKEKNTQPKDSWGKVYNGSDSDLSYWECRIFKVEKWEIYFHGNTNECLLISIFHTAIIKHDYLISFRSILERLTSLYWIFTWYLLSLF